MHQDLSKIFLDKARNEIKGSNVRMLQDEHI